MDYRELKRKEVDIAIQEGWELCVGCAYLYGDNSECPDCSITTMKLMGLPPEDSHDKTGI